MRQRQKKDSRKKAGRKANRSAATNGSAVTNPQTPMNNFRPPLKTAIETVQSLDVGMSFRFYKGPLTLIKYPYPYVARSDRRRQLMLVRVADEHKKYPREYVVLDLPLEGEYGPSYVQGFDTRGAKEDRFVEYAVDTDATEVCSPVDTKKKRSSSESDAVTTKKQRLHAIDPPPPSVSDDKKFRDFAFDLGYAVVVEQKFPGIPQLDTDIRGVMNCISKYGYGYIAYPIGGMDRARYDWPENLAEDYVIPRITLPDIQIPRSYWEMYVTGMVSPFVDPDNPNQRVSETSAHAISAELQHAAYIGVRMVMLFVRRIKYTELLKIVRHFVTVVGKDMNICLVYPTQVKDFLDEPPDDFQDIYNLWVSFRRELPFYLASRLSVGLEITYLDDEFKKDELVSRWKGEAINAFVIGNFAFTFEKELMKATHYRHKHLDLIAKLAVDPARQKFFYMPDTDTVPELDTQAYKLLFPALLRRIGDNLEATGYNRLRNENLQFPMETVWNDISGTVYDSMERDEVKYIYYGKALAIAWKGLEREDGEITSIYILGAGRGGLVEACIKTLLELKVPLEEARIFAIEKNPGAVAALTYLKRISNNWSNVYILEGDMRIMLQRPSLPKANIIMSELIGSLGDNELCPELWDCAPQIMKSSTVSIPTKLQSYICPLSAQIYAEQVSEAFDPKRCTYCRSDPLERTVSYFTPETWHDQIFVSPLRRSHEVGVPKPLFSFEFPNVDTVRASHHQNAEIEFDIPVSVEITGLIGYFSLSLCEEYTISNNKRFNKIDGPAPFGWYPAYIPLRGRGIHVQGKTVLKLFFSRHCVVDGVWYEWKVEYTPYGTNERVTTVTQNENGRTNFMSLPTNLDIARHGFMR